MRARSKSFFNNLRIVLAVVFCFWLFLSSGFSAEVKLKKTSGGGWVLLVDKKPFLIKGVAYNPIPPSKDYSYNFWAHSEILEKDAPLIKGGGFNTVRFYAPGENLQEVKNFIHILYEKYGIYTLMGSWVGFWNSPSPYYGDKEFEDKIIAQVLEMVKALKDEPGILMWVLGNENNFSFSGKVNPWTSEEVEKIKDLAQKPFKKAEIYYKFINRLAKEIK